MTIDQWTKTIDGDWSETAYWSAGQPTQLSDVVANMTGHLLSHSSGSDIVQSMTATQAFALTGGLLNLEGNTSNSFGAYSQSNSTLTINATTVVSGAAVLGAGTVFTGRSTAYSTIAFRAGASVQALSLAGLNFENDGTLAYSGGGATGITIGTTSQAAAIYNTRNAVFDIQDDSSVHITSQRVGFGRGATTNYYGVIYNSGTLKKSGGTGTSSIDGPFNGDQTSLVQVLSGTLAFTAAFSTFGNLDVEAGLLAFSSDFNSQGGATVAAGATVQFGGTPASAFQPYLGDSIGAGGNWTGGGTLQVKDSVRLFIGGTFTSNLAFVNSAVLDFIGAATLSGSLSNSGTVDVDGAVTLHCPVSGTGSFLINQGTLDVAGSVASGQSFVFNGPNAELIVEQPATFGATLAGANPYANAPSPSFYPGDLVDLSGVSADNAFVNASNQLVVQSQGATVAALQLAANFKKGSHFAVRSDGHGGTLLAQVDDSAFDFSGGSTQGILLRDTSSGIVSYWSLANGRFSGSTQLGGVGPNIDIAGSGDFNADGYSDLLLHDTSSGALSIWFTQFGGYAGTSTLGTISPQTQVAGIGDFTGNGNSDVLLRDTSTGDVSEWLVRNGQFATSRDLGGVGPSVDIAGVGDFDGDGTSDILLHDRASGAVSVWSLTNGYYQSSHQIGGIGSSVDIVGVGNFDGHGTSDILLHDRQSGAVSYWSVVNNQFAGSTQIGGIGAETQIVGARDIYGDGFSDVLLREASTGAISAFTLYNGQFSSFVPIGGVGATYQVIS